MNSHLLEHDALGHGRPTEGVRLHVRHGVGLVPLLLGVVNGGREGGGKGWCENRYVGEGRMTGPSERTEIGTASRRPALHQPHATSTHAPARRLPHDTNHTHGLDSMMRARTDLAGPLLVTAVHPELAPRARP